MAGLKVSPDISADMSTAGFSPGPSGAAVLAPMSPTFDSTPFSAQVNAETIPVKKTFVDWLLFRSIAKVRTRLFGTDGTLDIPMQEKDRRFMEPARAALDKHLDGIVTERFPAHPEKFGADFSKDFATRSSAEITRRLRELRATLAKERADLQQPYDVDAGVLAAAVALERSAAGVTSDIEVLALQEGVSFEEPEPQPLPPLPELDAPQAEAVADLATEAEPVTGMIPELPPLLVG